MIINMKYIFILLFILSCSTTKNQNNEVETNRLFDLRIVQTKHLGGKAYYAKGRVPQMDKARKLSTLKQIATFCASKNYSILLEEFKNSEDLNKLTNLKLPNREYIVYTFQCH